MNKTPAKTAPSGTAKKAAAKPKAAAPAARQGGVEGGDEAGSHRRRPHPHPHAKPASDVSSGRAAANTLPTPAPCRRSRTDSPTASRPPRAPARDPRPERHGHAEAGRARPTRSWPTPGRTRRGGPDRGRAAGHARQRVHERQAARRSSASRLQQQKDDLLSNAGETTEHLREDTVDRARPGRPRHHRGRARARTAHARPRAQAAEEDRAVAWRASTAGDYGYCDETGEPIGLARLLARPTATLSLEAQQRRELKQKMFGD